MISSKLIYQSFLGLVALSMRSSIVIATTAPTPAPTEIQPEWVPFYNTGTFASEDDVASNEELVEIWNRSPNQLIHRKCPACMPSHQDIFYRRFDTNGLPQYMDLLSTMTETWSSFGNQEILGQTFKLYSTYNDAINDTNAWTYCNYDLEDVGFPRECGVTVHTGGQYNSINLPSWPDIAFYVEALPVTSSPTEAPTASPTRAPTSSPTEAPTALDPAGYICLQTSELSWQYSQDAANTNGANLVSIHCSEQNQRLTQFLNSDERVWLGGSDSATEGNWLFTDGSSVSSYTNWGSGQPNNSYGSENCMELNYPSFGLWNDAPCTLIRKAIYYSPTPITGMTCMSYVSCISQTVSPTSSPTTAPTYSPTISPSVPSSTKAPSTSLPSLSTGKGKGSSTKSPSSKAPKSTKSPKSAKTSKAQKSSKSTKSTKTTTGSANNVTNSAGTKHILASLSYAMVIASVLINIE
ncbi:galactose-specific lectin nattectin-like [Chaetoceros tenuissimus]|uniref:Galactose-specific lectin nattectin-like n=1 Tax=Chaetoceros tenuissimus TaxID=426638 RepID=A0AAD3H2J3_9STRA|nr:galactose-specific lectin nattectin-like [Chaetoceros tenuissimus]